MFYERMNTKMEVKLLNGEQAILQEIASEKAKQKDVALTYAFLLRQEEDVDWASINQAIISRWSISGLNKIKKMARGLMTR